jgi:hypothetical protein
LSIERPFPIVLFVYCLLELRARFMASFKLMTGQVLTYSGLFLPNFEVLKMRSSISIDL